MNNDLLQRILIEIADQQGLAEISARIAAIRPDAITIKVAFLGEFNSGKSTIVNAVLRRKVLPMFATPTTASITEIMHGDHDEALVEIINGDNQKETTIISWSELANAILQTASNKKVLVRLKDIDFLPPRVLLVDTPGIASIQEMHDDITYGYLPEVDIAVVVVNPNSGAVPQTLIKFLSQFPKELLDKIYFVISRADEVPQTMLMEIKESVRRNLGQLFIAPRILTVSGLAALEAQNDTERRKESGILDLEDILVKEVPDKKNAIEQRRVAEALQEQKANLSQLLRKKLEAMDWSTEEFEEKIRGLKTQIAGLEKDIADYRTKFNSLKDRVLEAIGGIVSEYAELISIRTVRNESYEDLVGNMVGDIRAQVDWSIKELKGIEIRSFEKNMAGVLQALIEKSAAQIKDIANLMTDAATFLLTAWIVPGSTPGLDPNEAIIGAGVVFAEQADDDMSSAHSTRKTGGFAKALGAISRMVKGMNPLEKLKNVVLPYILNPGLTRTLTRKMKEKLVVVYDSIGQAIDQEIATRYLAPLKDYDAMLVETRKEKNKKIADLDASRDTIEVAISRLALLK